MRAGAARPAVDGFVALAPLHLQGRLHEGVPCPGAGLPLFVRRGDAGFLEHVDVEPDAHRIDLGRDRERLALRLEEVRDDRIEVVVAGRVDVPVGVVFDVAGQIREEAAVLEAGEVEVDQHGNVRQVAGGKAGQQPIVVLAKRCGTNFHHDVGVRVHVVHQQAVDLVPGAPYGELDLHRGLGHVGIRGGRRCRHGRTGRQQGSGTQQGRIAQKAPSGQVVRSHGTESPVVWDATRQATGRARDYGAPAPVAACGRIKWDEVFLGLINRATLVKSAERADPVPRDTVPGQSLQSQPTVARARPDCHSPPLKPA